MVRLAFIGCEVLAREFYLLAAEAEPLIDPVLLPIGLHNEPAVLRERVQQEINRMEGQAEHLPPDMTRAYPPPTYDAIVLGYALCSNGTVGLTSHSAPLVVPRGHDCMTLLLGARERYKEYFDSHRGIYWYSAGWIERSVQPGKERWERIYQAYVEKYGEDNAEYLMEMEQNWFNEYQWATYINWDLPGTERYRQFTKECAEFLKWNFDEVQGDPTLMRDLLNGHWDDDRFLVVQPGQYIEPSHDSCVLRACNECPLVEDLREDTAPPQGNVLRR